METLWKKLQFWKKKPMNPEDYIEGKHFRFVDSDDGKFTGIHLLLDNYVDVLYHYYGARVVEDNGIAKLQFAYNIVSPGKHDIDDLSKDEEFSKIMGDILSKILMEKQQYEATREYNPEELDS
jgi:hypothetical protein